MSIDHLLEPKKFLKPRRILEVHLPDVGKLIDCEWTKCSSCSSCDLSTKGPGGEGCLAPKGVTTRKEVDKLLDIYFNQVDIGL